MAEHTIFYMNGQKETIPGDMDEAAATGFFGGEVEVILKQDNLTFLAKKNQAGLMANPHHPAVKGPVVMINDSASW